MMTLEEFIAQMEEYKSEFFIANGRKPNTVLEFEQYLNNRRFRLNKPGTIKSVNWLFRGGKTGTDAKR